MWQAEARHTVVYGIVAVSKSGVFGNETLGVESGAAAGACGGYGLAVAGVGYVACGEYAFHVCGLGAVEGLDITGLIKLKLAVEEIGIGTVPDGEEETVDGQIGVLLYISAEIFHKMVLVLNSTVMLGFSSTRFCITFDARR